MAPKVDTCHHGRPFTTTYWWAGEPPCDDCDQDEWTRVRKDTIVGLVAILALIYVPLFLLLMGVFW